MTQDFGRRLNRGAPDARGAVEEALLAEADPIALLLGLRAERGRIGADPSQAPTLDKPAARKDVDVDKTARAQRKKAVR